MKIFFHLLALLLLGVGDSGAEPQSQSGKLIATGWDNPDTAQFRRDLKLIEKWPFRGVVLNANGRDQTGKAFDAAAAFCTKHWEKKFFAKALEDLKSSHSDRLTDNFLIFGANPGNVDWFDDAGWKEIEDHWRLLAWLAHDGGLKGVVFDPEAYTVPFKQFNYSAQPQRGYHSYKEYCLKARERGRAVMAAAVAEFPDMVLLSYQLLNACSRQIEKRDEPRLDPERSFYGLLPSFANGWLDMLSPAATIIDGNEGAYCHNSEAAFNADYVSIKRDCLALVSPENRAKYRAQVQVGHGIYLDAYVNESSSSYYVGGQGKSRASRLQENVTSAFHASDEYVWLYGEKGRWWPSRSPDEKARPAWPDLLPGVESALWYATDPTEWARRKFSGLIAHGPINNRLINGDFSRSSLGRPEAWFNWEPGWISKIIPSGHFCFDPDVGAASKGAACVSGSSWGCFLQGLKVEPGQRFLVRVKVRKNGVGRASLTVRWQNENGKWTANDQDSFFVSAVKANSLSWNEIVGAVTVPPGADRLMLLLQAVGQLQADDQIWFDDALVTPLVDVENK